MKLGMAEMKTDTLNDFLFQSVIHTKLVLADVNALFPYFPQA